MSRYVVISDDAPQPRGVSRPYATLSILEVDAIDSVTLKPVNILRVVQTSLPLEVGSFGSPFFKTLLSYSEIAVQLSRRNS